MSERKLRGKREREEEGSCSAQVPLLKLSQGEEYAQKNALRVAYAQIPTSGEPFYLLLLPPPAPFPPFSSLEAELLVAQQLDGLGQPLFDRGIESNIVNSGDGGGEGEEAEAERVKIGMEEGGREGRR